MKKCKQCNSPWQDEFNICPICGGDLVDESNSLDSMLNMGSGNAVSGGIHLSHDHSQKHDNSISSSNNTSNSNNSTTTNTTTQNFYGAMPFMQTKTVKSHEEILRERKIQYRECCKKVLADGLLNAEERNWLEEQRVLIDISAEVASSILNEVQISSRRSVMSMGTVHRIQLNNFKRAVEGNMVANIKRSMPQIKVVAEKFQEEEVQFLYYMVMAALDPNECVESYQNRRDDKYWLTFWAYVAFHKLGDVQNAENAMIELAKWQGLMPDENTVVLAALGSLMDGDKDMASDMCMQVDKNEYTPLLDPIMEVLYAINNYSLNDKNIMTILQKNKFYVDNFLDEIYKIELEEKLLAEEEKKRKEEEERKRKEAELKRQREEKERKREEEEKLRREEESRRRMEEERKRLEQERQRLEAECKQRDESERKLREAELKRQQEVAERLKIEEESRKKMEEERKLLEQEKQRVEAECKQKEEVERISKASELKRQQEVADRLKREEESRKKIEEERKLLEHERQLLEVERKKKEEAERIIKASELKRQQDESKRNEEAERLRREEELCKKIEEERKLLEQERHLLEVERKKKEELERRYCPQCGKLVDAAYAFCMSCGHKLK